MKYNKKFYEKYSMKVTEDPIKDYTDNKLDNTIERMHRTVRSGNLSKKTIAELEGLVEIHPHITSLKNYLYVAYNFDNQKSKALDILHTTIKQHPDYIFGHLNMATHYLTEGHVDKAASTLIEPYDVRKLEKGEFIHISAFKSYYTTAIEIEIERKNLEKAEALHRILFDYNKNEDIVKKLARKIVVLRMLLNPIFKKAPSERKVETISKPIQGHFLLDANGNPIFNHLEIQQLYQYSLDNIPQSVIKSIMSLPRTTLVQDLEHALSDMVLRWENHFSKIDYEDDTHSFGYHALYFLTALKSYESLQTILNILRQDNEILEYWFADSIDSYFNVTLYLVGENQLNMLKAFALEENIIGWNRAIACKVAAQVALKQPERREEVLLWFKEIIDFHLQNPDNQALIDTHFLSCLVGELTDFAAIELENDIKALYEQGWIEDSMNGNFETVLKELKKPIRKYHIEPMPDNIYELYSGEYLKRQDNSDYERDSQIEDKLNDPHKMYLAEIMVGAFTKAFKSKIGEEEDEDDEAGYYDDDEEDYDWEPQLPVKRTEPKVGRNDPCPCGSGKKYKKCHGK